MFKAIQKIKFSFKKNEIYQRFKYEYYDEPLNIENLHPEDFKTLKDRMKYTYESFKTDDSVFDILSAVSVFHKVKWLSEKNYGIVLLEKNEKLITVDDYGNRNYDKWNKELAYFAKHNGQSMLSAVDQEIPNYYKELARSHNYEDVLLLEYLYNAEKEFHASSLEATITAMDVLDPLNFFYYTLEEQLAQYQDSEDMPSVEGQPSFVESTPSLPNRVKNIAVTYRYEEDILISNFAFKEIEYLDNFDEIKLSLKVDIENMSDSSSVMISVQALDEEGFEVDKFYLDGKVTKGTKGSITSKSGMDFHLYSQTTKLVVST